MSLPNEPSSNRLSNDQLLKLITPDINSGIEGKPTEHLPQIFKNIGGIIAAEGRRALEFIKHPFDTGFLTNRKIIEKLVEPSSQIMEQVKSKLNLDNTKYKKGHRKEDLDRRINELAQENVGQSVVDEENQNTTEEDQDTKAKTETETRVYEWTEAQRPKAERGKPTILNRAQTVFNNTQVQPIAKPNVALKSKYFPLITKNLNALVARPEIQEVLQNLRDGKHTIQIDSSYLREILAGLPSEFVEAVIEKFPNPTVEVEKKGNNFTVSLPKLQSFLPLSESTEAEGISTVGLPNVTFGNEELEKFISNFNLVIESKEIQALIEQLKPGSFVITLDATLKEKLVNGLTPRLQEQIKKRLDELTILVNKDPRGISFTIYEQANRLRLPVSFAYDPKTPGRLAAALAEALKTVFPQDVVHQDAAVMPFLEELAKSNQVLSVVGRKRIELEKALFQPEITPEKVRKIRRELISLRNGIGKALERLRTTLVVAEKTATPQQIQPYRGVENRLGLELHALRFILRPEPIVTSTQNRRALIQSSEGVSGTSPGNPVLQPILDDLGEVNSGLKTLLEKSKEQALSQEQKKGVLESLKRSVAEAKDKISDYDNTKENLGQMQQSALSRSISGVEKTIAELNKKIVQLESELAPIPEPPPTILSKATLKIGLNRELGAFERTRKGILEKFTQNTSMTKEIRQEAKNQLQSLQRSIRLKHKEYLKKYDQIGSNESSEEMLELAEQIGNLKGLIKQIDADIKIVTTVLEPRKRTDKTSSSEGLKVEETPVNFDGLDPESFVIPEKSKDHTNTPSSSRPSLAKLAFLTLTMVLGGRWLMGGQSAEAAVANSTQSVFAPFTSTGDWQFGTNLVDFESEENRGFSPFSIGSEKGDIFTLDDIIQQGSPEDSVKAASQLIQNPQATPQAKREAVRSMFGEEANYDYVKKVTESLVAQGKAGDRRVESELKPIVDAAKEVLLAKRIKANDPAKENAATILQSIARGGLYQREILSIESPMIRHVVWDIVRLPFSPTEPLWESQLAYDIAKREYEKGEASLFSSNARVNLARMTEPSWKFNLRPDPMHINMEAEGIENFNGHRMSFVYERMFSKENAPYAEQLVTDELAKLKAIKAGTSNELANEDALRGTYRAAAYGILAHPENESPHRVLSKFIDHDEFVNEIIAIPSSEVFVHLRHEIVHQNPVAIAIAKREIANGDLSYLSGKQRAELKAVIGLIGTEEEYYAMLPETRNLCSKFLETEDEHDKNELKSVLDSVVDVIKEVFFVAERENQNDISVRGANTLCAIAEEGLYVPQIISIPSPKVLPALAKYQNTFVGYKIIKSELEKGESSYIPARDLEVLKDSVLETDSVQKRILDKLPGDPVNEIVDEALSLYQLGYTLEVDYVFAYPYVFGTKERVDYLRDKTNTLLDETGTSEDMKTIFDLGRIYRAALWGGRTHPENPVSNEILELFKQRGFFDSHPDFSELYRLRLTNDYYKG